MNKAVLRVLSLLLIVIAILTLLLAVPPQASALARQAPKVTPAATRTLSVSPTPTAVDRSVPGSTDGIVIMSFAIALIIVLPILLQRGLWGK